MKTAMQDAIDMVQLAREGEAENDLRTIIYNLKSLLEKEKSQIKDSWRAGYDECENFAQDRQTSSESYYNKTFTP